MDYSLFSIGETTITPSTLLVILVIILVTFRGSRLVRRTVEARLVKRGGAPGTVNALSALLHYVIIAVGLSVALQTAGINLTAVLAAGAVFAVGIGLAMQSVAQNFVSGIILLIERSVRPGDVIEIEGLLCRVSRMGIRATVVETRDATEIILPNSTLSQGAVTNYTLANTSYRLRFKVGVVYGADMKRVYESLIEAAREVEQRDSSREPEAIIVDFGDNAVVFEVGLWIRDPWGQRVIRAALADRIWWTFKDSDIVIAFPQLDVHFDEPVVKSLAALSGKAA